jgi:hypothetical protein
MMPKKRGMTQHDWELAEFLRLGGGKIPAGVAAKAKAAVSMPLKKRDAGIELQMQGAKLYGELKGGSPTAVDDPANRETLEAILRLHKKAARTKVPFPKIAAVPAWVSTILSGTVTPPFQFAYTDSSIITHPRIPLQHGQQPPIDVNPIMSATASANGQISVSVASSEAGVSDGIEQATVGMYFRPQIPGTLTISARPTYSFAWATNSLKYPAVLAIGSIALGISGEVAGGKFLETADTVQVFSESTPEQVQFDVQSDVQKSLSASLNVTHPNLFYCYVSVAVRAWGMGWPGSLAVAMMSATVPSISYEFSGELPAEP